MRIELAVVVAAVALGACGARTTLSTTDDAGAADAGTDAGRAPSRDAGRRDGGVDAGPRPDAGRRVECARDADCDDGVCRAFEGLRPDDLAPMPLTCGVEDPLTPVGGVCQNRVDCGRGLCALAGTCVQPCVADVDCAPSQACREVYVRTAVAAMQTLRACTATIAAPEGVRVAGPEPRMRIPPFRSIGDDLPDLSPNALVIWETAPEAVVFIDRVSTPDGERVYEAFEPSSAAPTWGLNPLGVGGYVTALYPNGPATPVSEGGFAVRLTSMAGPSRVTRTLAQREGEGVRFDVDAYLVGGNGWTSPDGAVPPALARAFELARASFATVGVTLGEVRIHEVVGGLRDRLSVATGSEPPFDLPPELPEMWRLSAGATRPSVHVYFVREIAGALGVSAGIPGAQILPGASASGVAIATDFAGPDELPVVLVHEIGHFMGLFHTVEFTGDVQDPLPDTPACLADRDANGDGFVDPMECAEFGADNVMFWAGVAAGLTPHQGEVIRRAFFLSE